ncbi:MAG TPA: cell wall-binding repeat-containing protein [Candidatus Nanopelagicales bacterium]|nr:cell wall-binding repeat-containing protein [Candidatus Nanopelagicales bacterium]
MRAYLASITALSLAVLGVSGQSTAAHAAPPGVSITNPADGATVPEGDLHITGTAGSSSPRAKDYVVFTTDLSGSTTTPSGMDCSGDGIANSTDDLNGDGIRGDVLDCEIAGIQALNDDLGQLPDANNGVRVGVVGFGDQAAVARMSTAGEGFVAPQASEGGATNVDVVTGSLTAGEIGEYTSQDVGYGTDFNAAVDKTLDSLGSVTGNKWVFFLSDGYSAVSRATLSRLAASGAKVRTFAIGRGAGSDACNAGEPLAEIAAATGESCNVVVDPSDLLSGLTGSQPNDLKSVVVSGVGSDVNASIDTLGNFDAVLPGLTAGTYTATATATFADNSTDSDSVTFTVQAAPDKVVRWAGADRYEASADISAESFDPGVRRAFVASGLIFTDALSGSAVAGKTPGPMLLVKTDEIPSAIRDELVRLQPKEIIVLGGSNTISPRVESQLESLTTGAVRRWDGSDRYEASADISANTFDPGVETAFVASGLIFTDALSGSPIAGKTPGPMLLVETDEIPPAIAAELTRLKPKEIVVLGGPATVTDAVQQQLKRFTNGVVDRWDGLDRYEASAKISAKSFRPGVRTAFIASGLIFTDALSGSPIAGATPGPMLLVKSDDIPPSIETELNRLKPQRIVILGGPATVSAGVEASLEAFVRAAN